MALRIRALVAALICGLAPGLGAQPAGDADEGLTLKEVVNRAHGLVATQDSPMSAIRRYYQPYLGSPTFDKALTHTQHRFLFEFTVACDKAATKASSDQSLHYLELCVDICRSYVDWFDGARPSTSIYGRSFNAVLHLLGMAHERFNTTARKIGNETRLPMGDLLNKYEEYSRGYAELFSPRCVRIWREALDRYPDYDYSDGRMAKEAVRSRIDGDMDYELRWQAFRDFLKEFKAVPKWSRIGQREFVNANYVLREGSR